MTGSVLLQAGRAEAEALGKAIASVRTAPDGLEQLAAQMEMLTARCLAYPAEVQQLWDGFERQEPCGMVDELIVVVDDYLSLLDERLKVVNQVRSLAAEMPGRSGA